MLESREQKGNNKRVCSECGSSFEPYQHNQKKCYNCISVTDKRFREKPKKECPICSKDFQPRTIRHTYCSDECSKEGWRQGYFRREYGLSVGEYEKLFFNSSGTCYICGTSGFKINTKTKASLCVDHDHSTGNVRGLLCHNCNRALGLLGDNVSLLKKAIRYLEGSETIL